MASVLLGAREPSLTEVVADGLASAGHAVTVAATPEEMISTVKDKPFDVVLLDYYLPLVSRRQFVVRLQNVQTGEPPQIVLMIENGVMTPGNARRLARILKPFDLLWSPLEIPKILKTVERAVKARQQR